MDGCMDSVWLCNEVDYEKKTLKTRKHSLQQSDSVTYLKLWWGILFLWIHRSKKNSLMSTQKIKYPLLWHLRVSIYYNYNREIYVFDYNK